MLQIMNAALASQGLDMVASESDGTPEYNVLSRNWPSIVEAELEDGAYSFTKKQALLESRQEGKFGFVDSYITPAAAIHVRRVWTLAADGVTRYLEEWVQDGTNVHVDEASGIYIEYVEVADPTLWGANFVRGVQMKLEAALLRAVKEEMGEAVQMEQGAEYYFQRARTISSKSRSATEPYRSNRFKDARFGRGS